MFIDAASAAGAAITSVTAATAKHSHDGAAKRGRGRRLRSILYPAHLSSRPVLAIAVVTPMLMKEIRTGDRWKTRHPDVLARSLATQLDEMLTHLQQQLLNQRQRIARGMPLALLHRGNVFVQFPALALSQWRQPEPLRVDFELLGILAGQRPDCLGERLVQALLANIGTSLHPSRGCIHASGRLDTHLPRLCTFAAFSLCDTASCARLSWITIYRSQCVSTQREVPVVD
ncbi:hypothetical protein [Rubrivivax sp. JA1026]|uniref:hypothetical protein n=1 Tax=Rubrivivax sp. JA1026 TaxID=2710888 RepID=UPI001F0D1356|nr:hypothetical protein [Rubrivivax sp. JA1026]